MSNDYLNLVLGHNKVVENYKANRAGHFTLTASSGTKNAKVEIYVYNAEYISTESAFVYTNFNSGTGAWYILHNGDKVILQKYSYNDEYYQINFLSSDTYPEQRNYVFHKDWIRNFEVFDSTI